jgi:SNF2 family DNA or RNA helicase
MLTKPLHPYQIEPVRKFLERGNLLIAYEMGLGKTPIALACAEELLGCGDIATVLVVVPASLKYQWAQKIAEFVDVPVIRHKVKKETIVIPGPQSCVVIDGPPGTRQELYTQVKKRPPAYIIMSYENVVNDHRFIRGLRPGLVILDECTAIKTFRAQRTKRIKQMLDAPYRIGLTGTPVENKPEELFSIMQWVDPSVLGRFDLFDRAYIVRDHFGRVKYYRNLPTLRNKLRPAVSRKSRLDPDVAAYLPDVDYGTWAVPMDSALKDAYRAIAADLYTELKALPASGNFDLAAYYSGGFTEENSALGNVMARQMALEMILDHPQLLHESARHYLESQEAQDRGEERKIWPGSKYACTRMNQGLTLSARSPKLDLLMEKVSEILEFDERNKVLVFSRFTGMLPIFQEAFSSWNSVIFHGGMNAAAKAEAIAKFSRPECRLFFSSHAGAYGNDMHMANYLINYDLPWSAGRADQINGRHVRASSQFTSVFIRDLITQGSIEERRQQMLTLKRKVGSAILDGHGQDADGHVVNDLQSLLTHLTEVLGL